MPVIGLTGGPGTGKSAIAAMLADLGAVTLSADAIAHRLLEPGQPIASRVAEVFGAGILTADGGVDRRRLARIVFSDEEARRRLESLTHPAILAELRRGIQEVQRARGEGAVIVVEAPLLFEAGMEGWFHRIVAVAASREAQIRRLALRDGMPAQEAEQRIRAQMELGAKMRRAHIVIWNEACLKEVKRRVGKIWPLLAGSV
ncbi:MAG: dephospho-CoA kinase [Chthonomonadales bacterium]